MASNIQDLREYLFDTIEAVREKRLDAESAIVIAKLASEISKTAQIEASYAKTSGKLVDFIENS